MLVLLPYQACWFQCNAAHSLISAVSQVTWVLCQKIMAEFMHVMHIQVVLPKHLNLPVS